MTASVQWFSNMKIWYWCVGGKHCAGDNKKIFEKNKCLAWKNIIFSSKTINFAIFVLSCVCFLAAMSSSRSDNVTHSSVRLFVPFFLVHLRQRRMTSHDVATPVLLSLLVCWRNSNPFFGMYFLCRMKIGDFWFLFTDPPSPGVKVWKIHCQTLPHRVWQVW